MAYLAADHTPAEGHLPGLTSDPDAEQSEHDEAVDEVLAPLATAEYAGPVWLTAPRRRWLYGIICAIVPVLVAAGFLTEHDAAAWAGVAAAVLGQGLALANTTDRPIR